jgi:iron complex outermembrane receptor protein
LQAAGQPRIVERRSAHRARRLYDAGLVLLDDADPDWDARCEQINESEYNQFDVNLTLDLNDRWSFTSITGLSEFESSGITDWVMLGTEERHEDVESEVLYQELQLNASWDRFDLVTGLSYFQEDVFGSPGTGGPNYDRRGTSIYGPAAGPPPVPAGGLPNGNSVALGTGPNGLFSAVFLDGLQETQSTGLFANLTWHITDRLNVTPGVRFAYDDKQVRQTRFAQTTSYPSAEPRRRRCWPRTTGTTRTTG